MHHKNATSDIISQPIDIPLRGHPLRPPRRKQIPNLSNIAHPPIPLKLLSRQLPHFRTSCRVGNPPRGAEDLPPEGEDAGALEEVVEAHCLASESRRRPLGYRCWSAIGAELGLDSELSKDGRAGYGHLKGRKERMLRSTLLSQHSRVH